MMQEDMIQMTKKEFIRFQVIQKVVEKIIRQKEAASTLHLSLRQIKRLAKRIRLEGNTGIIHKARGKPSNRKIQTKEKILNLYKAKYAGFGPTLAQEKLFENHKIKLSDETLRLWLKDRGLFCSSRKKSPHRQWRERKDSFGQMIQMDGSHHDWLEGRGPKLVLMGYIDDATNTVFARFYDYEGTLPAMDSFHQYLKRYGIPQSIYFDKHVTYKSPAKPTLEEEINQKAPKSQFERALEELGVQAIHAHSPQAKGRIERLFGIFQDRLIKELRLAHANNKDSANAFLKGYLPRYNRRFQRIPKSDKNLHRPAPAQALLKRILSIQTRRVLRSNNTIWHNGRIFLVEERFQIRPKDVLVEERLDGRFYLMDKDQSLSYKEVQEPPLRIPAPRRPRKIVIPPKDHPFRRWTLKKDYTHSYDIRTIQDVEALVNP